MWSLCSDLVLLVLARLSSRRHARVCCARKSGWPPLARLRGTDAAQDTGGDTGQRSEV